MDTNGKKLDDYISKLNLEQKPEEHEKPSDSNEMDKLLDAVRQVRTLREPAMPDKEFPMRMAMAVYEHSTIKNQYIKQAEKSTKIPVSKPVKRSKRLWLAGLGTAAAVLVLVITLNFIIPLGGSNIVYAMENTVQSIKAYHGYLEIVETNALGDASTQAKLEVWADSQERYYVKELEGPQKGLVTVNNGNRKWQFRPDEKKAYGFDAFPDPYRFTFELGKEIDDVRNAIKTEIVGEEAISGRNAVVLEVTPQGGAVYKLWIDKETKLPLQKQSAMQNALQYRVTYTEVETEAAIPGEFLTYSLPAGYTEVNTTPEQIVADSAEAQAIAGFTPRIPESLPDGYSLRSYAVETADKAIKLEFAAQDTSKRIILLEGKAKGKLEPASGAIIADVGDNKAEVQSPVQEGSGVLADGSPYAGATDITSIRWQQDGFEYAVLGNAPDEVLAQFIKSLGTGDLKLPSREAGLSDRPQVEVPVDMEVERNEQKSVDAGHSPWRLDPAFVAQVFVSLKISPEGITGDYPIKYEDLKVAQDNSKEAIVTVGGDNSPVSRVFLKRLVRQDSTGIWTVTGYDPAKSGK